MHLDTESLKAKIESEKERMEEEKENLRQEILRLESEQDRLSEAFEAVEAVERMAKELEVLSHLQSASTQDQAPEQHQGVEGETRTDFQPAYSEESSDSLIQDFKQWA